MVNETRVTTQNSPTQPPLCLIASSRSTPSVLPRHSGPVYLGPSVSPQFLPGPLCYRNAPSSLNPVLRPRPGLPLLSPMFLSSPWVSRTGSTILPTKTTTDHPRTYDLPRPRRRLSLSSPLSVPRSGTCSLDVPSCSSRPLRRPVLHDLHSHPLPG